MGIDPSSIPDLDPTKPSVARIYDCLLGGDNNLPVDQQVAERTVQVMPGVREVVRANRVFLGRAVRFMCQAGVRQFLDIGSGLPSQGNVHEVAETATGGTAKTVYSDQDPLAVLHGQAMLAESTTSLYLLGDARDPERILDGARQWLDFDQPVGVLMVALLHNLDAEDDDAYAVVDRLRAPLVPGSHLALTHIVTGVGSEVDEAEERVGSGLPYHPRSVEQVRGFFGGMELVPPGLVPVADWRPEAAGTGTEQTWLVGGVGVKRS